MKKALKIFLVVILLLIGLRIALEPIVEHYVNRSLNEMEGYSGSIRDVDINLFRGAYRIEGMTLKTTEGHIQTPFLEIDTMDLSLQWDALLQCKVVGNVTMFHPVLNFVYESQGEDSQTGEETDWIAQLEAVMPLTVNQFEVKNGSITFQDSSVTPPVNLRLDNLYLEAHNLSNVRDSLTELPASLSAAATSVGNGKLSVDMKMDILNEIPAFDARLKLMSVDLTKLNDFIKAYANFDVQQGTFSLITEMKADNGKLNGYIKPFFENLDVFDLEQDMKQKDGFFQKVWEGLVGLGAEALENQPKDRVATQVPIQGDIQSPDTNVPVTIFNILRNAFVDAINKEFEKNAVKS